MRNIILDICDTLYYSNTTFDFLSYLDSRENNRNRVLLSLRKMKFIMCINAFIFKFSHIDLFRKICIFFILKGKEVSYINNLCDEFVHKYLIKKKIPATFKIIEKYSHQNNIIICSASISPIVSSIAKNIQCNTYFSTELEVKNNTYTGKVKNDILGKKSSILAGLNYDLVITDNKSDIDIIKKSKNVILISVEKNITFWNEFLKKNKDINAEIIIV